MQRHPEGYRKLLVYQKAEENQRLVLELIRHIPHRERATRDLRDQMPPSARSVAANIAEGWKRRYTNEYLTFTGYAEASNAELMEDCRRIATGFYPQLAGITGLMGKKGGKAEWYGSSEMEKLRFYPLDISLPPVVQVFLRCKEIDYLLSRLKLSLGEKMEKEKTVPQAEKIRRRMREEEAGNRKMEEMIKSMGMIRLINGQIIDQQEYGRRKAAGENIQLFGE